MLTIGFDNRFNFGINCHENKLLQRNNTNNSKLCGTAIN